MDELFETIGFHISQVKDATPVRAFRFRFPWLIATITGGSIAAVLAGFFEVTIAKSIILAFFLTLVLGLGRGVATQSMAVTIQKLRHTEPTFAWYYRMFLYEFGTAFCWAPRAGQSWGSSYCCGTGHFSQPFRWERASCWLSAVRASWA